MNGGGYKIIDCRYPYEFRGGHINSAENHFNIKDTIDLLFKKDVIDSAVSTVLILHCEFSSERAPKMAREIRKVDRTMHVYPDLKYPEIYILAGGYKQFSHKYP